MDKFKFMDEIFHWKIQIANIQQNINQISGIEESIMKVRKEITEDRSNEDNDKFVQNTEESLSKLKQLM